MGGQKSQHPGCHFAASGMAACINFPLWKASAIGQSGFTAGSTRGRGVIGRYLDAMKPPYKGVSATILGMTWARAFIFYGSDMGKAYLESIGVQNPAVTVMVPPLVTSTMVQLVNMPVIRASVTIQNPASEYTNVREALRAIHSSKGLAGLWHGTSAGIMKTVPKYCVAVGVKHGMEKWLPKNDNELARSAAKSVAAGVSGAVLTNPLVSSLGKSLDNLLIVSWTSSKLTFLSLVFLVLSHSGRAAERNVQDGPGSKIHPRASHEDRRLLVYHAWHDQEPDSGGHSYCYHDISHRLHGQGGGGPAK
ncbi:unnamed protein product [Chrysoparadoxa australica]